MPAFSLTNPLTIRTYHHTFMRPLTPATPASAPIRLNHFACLHLTELIEQEVNQIEGSPAIQIPPVITPNDEKKDVHNAGTHNQTPRSEPPLLKQSDLRSWCKPVSLASKRKGISVKVQNKLPKVSKTGTISQKAAAKRDKNLLIMQRFCETVTINKSAAENFLKLRLEEMQRRADLDERLSQCTDAATVNEVLSGLLEQVVKLSDDEPSSTFCKIVAPTGRPKELTWEMRSHLIAFYLHPDLGGSDFSIFGTVFGDIVRPETLRSWLRKENIYKWIGYVKLYTKADIMRVIRPKHRYIFQNGREEAKVGDKALAKFISVEAQLQTTGKQRQLLINKASFPSKNRLAWPRRTTRWSM
jgi:hypothetical protein